MAMQTDEIEVPNMCRKLTLPCPAGERFRDAITCREYYECGDDGQFLIKRLCPDGSGFDDDKGYCAEWNTFECPSPVFCPNTVFGQSIMYPHAHIFPTEFVIGGTLGAFGVITFFILVFACIRKWRMEKYTRRLRYKRPNIRSRRLFPHSDSRDYHHGKLATIYEKFNEDNGFFFCPQANQQRRARCFGEYAPTFDSRSSTGDPALFIPREHRDRREPHEPSIVAGSFIYHTPTNLPPHMAGDLNHNLSYDSFKNNHMYDNEDNNGARTSTLTRHPVHF